MMNDNNNHYSDVFGDEIKNHRRKKSKGKTRDPRTDQSELVSDFQNYAGPVRSPSCSGISKTSSVLVTGTPILESHVCEFPKPQ